MPIYTKPHAETIEKVPPIDFRSAKGTPLTAYSVTGNLSQTGTPTPTEPVTPEECGDLVTTGEHAGEYCIPLSVSGTDYPIYLSEPLREIGDYADSVDSSGVVTRRIRKLVLTGTEDWIATGTGTEIRFYTTAIRDYALSSSPALCTDYTYGNARLYGEFEITEAKSLMVNKTGESFSDFKQRLADRYAANTPVTVWYVLASAITETTTAPTITPASGSNTLTVGTTLAPSEVSITVPDLYQSISKIPIGDGTNEALKVYANDGRMVYDIRADVARQMAKQFDGTAATYKSVMQSFFNLYNADSVSSSVLTDICRAWYKGTRDDWNGYTTFSTTSGSSSGTRGGDNAGLTCVPSTNDTAGQDDFAGLPLFYPIDVNYEVDADTKDIIITGIDGITSSFDRYDPDKFVGVMQMSAYVWHSEDAVNETFTDGYSAKPVTTADSCWMLPEAVRMDGTVREYVVHPKYMGTVVNGKLKCYSGVTPSAYVISHNTLNSYGKANGNQYSGGSVTLLGFLEIMTRIKYASLTQDGIIQGCLNYNVQSPVAAATTSKQYVLLSAANAEKYIIGSTVLIGTATGTSAPDRGVASAYSVTGQAGTVVTKITDDPDGSANKAVWFENLAAFSATGSGSYASGVTVISTFAWQNGSCDGVLGNDGSPASPSVGKYTAMIQGIEYSVGIYEVYGDMLMQANPATTEYPLGYYTFFICKDASKRSTDVTANYTELPAKLPYVTNTTAAWRYIKTMSFSNGIIVPTDCSGGSSTAFSKDAFYFLATPNSRTTRERLCFGNLSTGVGGGGLSGSNGGNAPSNAHWVIGGRPSCGEAFRA